jgi:hypothetical protein
MNETNSEEKRMESMRLLDNTIRSYREQRYDLELILETAPVSSCWLSISHSAPFLNLFLSLCLSLSVSLYVCRCLLTILNRGIQDIQTVLSISCNVKN